MPLGATRGGAAARAACALAVLWVATFGGSAGGVVPDACPGRLRARPDGWTELRPPAFAAGPAEISAYVAAPTDERVVVVTNGVVVQRSGDAGCTWQEVHRATATTPGGTATVAHVVATPAEGATGPLLMSVRETYLDAEGVRVARTRVLVSTDAGRTWTEGGTGLPPAGEPMRLRIGGLRPGAAYLLVRGLPGRPPATYRTLDAGLTWSLRNGPSGAVLDPDRNLPYVDDLVVDPGSPDNLFAWDDRTLWRSPGAGYAWGRVGTVVAPVMAVDVAPSPLPGRRTRVRVFHPDGTSEYSDDNAVSWLPHDEGGPVTSVASIPVVAGLYATSSPAGVRINGVTLPKPIDVTPRGVTLTDLAFTISDRPYLYGRSGALLLRRELSRPRERVALGDTPIGLLRAMPPRRPRPASFDPARLAARLDLGERRRLTTILTLPPDPTPLDVYFLSDTTGSMAPVVDGLRQDLAGIVNQLADAGIPTWFGVADFREYPPPWGNGPDSFPYRRLRAVGPVNEELRAALARMDVGGGARDGSDSALEALYQAATGAGRLVADGTEGTPVRLIEQALDAEFRSGAVRVIVLASDTAWRDAQPGYPGPSEAVTFRALRERGIHVVGLAVGGDVDRPWEDGRAGGPGPDLRQVAEATGTRAPAGGVDCDGDGVRELPAGAPLVCTVDPANGGPSVIGPAMASLLTAVSDPVPVGLRVFGPPDVVWTLQSVRHVDRKRSAAIRVTTVVSCDDRNAGRTFDARIEAHARGRDVATAVVSVACGVRDAAAPDAAPPVAGPVAGALPFVPLPPPPPAPIPHPNPNVNSNPNPQLDPHAQAGLAPRADEQHQLAFADKRTELPADLAFSRYEDPALPLLGAAVLMAAAAAVHHHRRAQPASSRSRA